MALRRMDGCLAHLFQQIVIIEELLDPGCHRLYIARGNKESGFSVSDLLRDTSHCSRHNWSATG